MNNHFISLSQAIDMTTRYRSEKENILSPEFKGKNILLLAETFDRALFDKLLSEKDCASIRIYFGMKEDLQVRVIVVGVNSKNEDLLPAGEPGSATTETDGNSIGEEGAPCPTWCPVSSPLNG